ncbi:unnamed protein product [Sphenostylis stenocarpa]|uniref:Uncharacterized protein n=1 Tax=Sphenostylis stenocarpa TaxID=92480 RepID=A0AA86SDA6_9FABA|nr:unnamed protein product [Sphenostylis stenocarpa]
METGGDNKNVGDHNLDQTSQSTEQGDGITSKCHMESHPSSPSSQKVPSDETNNTVRPHLSLLTSANESSPGNSSQNQPSASVTVPTNVESHAPAKSSEDDVPINFVPNHEHSGVAGGANQGLEIQNPPVQVMERPGESSTPPHYSFPSHVFSNSNMNSPVEWSTASNESLFSIYMGNSSFSTELGCFKSGEFDKPGDITPANKFQDISNRSHEEQLLNEHSSKANEAKAAEIMREVIMESSRTTQNDGKGDEKAFNSHHESTESTSSYAFLSSSRNRDKIPSLSVREKQSQQKESEENETQNTADQTPKSTTNASKNWLSCFACC